ncbi:hypothetical protein NM688_g8221 [Phlebia brevispora]|uniref:Uncharacterized protein n=1 Tax=Phlebia brevispora TaxID=194682 RepID=A0ACC1RVS7_9APHY|nr:hypothetical protein NM688_g8221 [Phlebia brevispora]
MLSWVNGMKNHNALRATHAFAAARDFGPDAPAACFLSAAPYSAMRKKAGKQENSAPHPAVAAYSKLLYFPRCEIIMESSTSYQRRPNTGLTIGMDALLAEYFPPAVVTIEEERLAYERIGQEVTHIIRMDPEGIIALLQRIHLMTNSDSHKYFYMRHVTTSLVSSDDSTWEKLRYTEPTIGDLLVDIILDGALCGFSEEELFLDPEAALVPYANRNFALLLNTAMHRSCAQFTPSMLSDDPRPDSSIGYAKAIHRRVHSVWERLSQIVAPSDYGESKLPHVVDLLHTYMMWIGYPWVHLHCVFYNTPPADKNIMQQCLYTFCFAQKELYCNEALFMLLKMFDWHYLSQEKIEEICNEVFRREETAQAFIDACSAVLAAPKLRVLFARNCQPLQAILHFQAQVFASGVQVLLGVASATKSMNKIFGNGLRACQRLKCQHDADMEQALKSISAILNCLLVPFWSRFCVEYDVACTVLFLAADILEDMLRERQLENAGDILVFIQMYSTTALVIPTSRAHGKMHKDILHLRYTVNERYRALLRDLRLSRLPSGATKAARDTMEHEQMAPVPLRGMRMQRDEAIAPIARVHGLLAGTVLQQVLSEVGLDQGRSQDGQLSSYSLHPSRASLDSRFIMEDSTAVHRQMLLSDSLTDSEPHFVQYLAPIVFSGEEAQSAYDRIREEVVSSLQTNPGHVIELLQSAHTMANDDSCKHYYIHHITTQLGLSDDELWMKLRDSEPKIENVLINIMSDGDFCGFSREELYKEPELIAFPYTNYVHNIALLFNMCARKLLTLFLLLRGSRADALIGPYAEIIQRKVDPIWERLSQVMQPSDYIKKGFPDVADALQACVMWIGHGWLVLRCASKYSAPAAEQEVARQSLYTFCTARRELYRNECFFLLYNMIHAKHISEDELIVMCNEVFRDEETSQAFIDACVATLSTPKLSVVSTKGLPDYQPVQALLWFQQQVIARGPQMLRDVASRCDNMSRLGNSGMLACQRLKCQCGGDSDAERALNHMCAFVNYLLFTFKITTHFDQRVACTGLLLGADLLEKAA